MSRFLLNLRKADGYGDTPSTLATNGQGNPLFPALRIRTLNGINGLGGTYGTQSQVLTNDPANHSARLVGAALAEARQDASAHEGEAGLIEEVCFLSCIITDQLILDLSRYRVVLDA